MHVDFYKELQYYSHVIHLVSRVSGTLDKEVLCGGISTLSTDFSKMGDTLASLVFDPEIKTIANPCRLIIRGSV